MLMGFPINGDINRDKLMKSRNFNLEDAASTSLSFGSRLGGPPQKMGVVLITTKKVVTKGQTNVNLNVFTGWQNVL